MIDKYGEFLLPDLKHHYGIDLRDLFLEVPPWSPQFVLAHINNLTYDSAFVAELRGGQRFRGWDQGRYMQANEIDAIRTQTHFFIKANIDPAKAKKLDPPEPYPIPDQLDKKKRQDSPGSFGFISKNLIAKAKKRKGGV